MAPTILTKFAGMYRNESFDGFNESSLHLKNPENRRNYVWSNIAMSQNHQLWKRKENKL